MSKNLTLSQNYSRDASHHEFALKPGSILVGNNQPYGSLTINQTAVGVNYPNVQAAIDDMPALYTLPLNTIISNVDGISPAGTSQIDEFKFTGQIKDPSKLTGDPIQFNFYGFPTTVLVGDTGEEVAGKVKLQLELAKSAGKVINNVIFGATLDILQIKYNDFQTHVLDQTVQYSVKVVQTTISPAKSGYGVWSRVGTQTITLDGASAPTLFYYFKREA